MNLPRETSSAPAPDPAPAPKEAPAPVPAPDPAPAPKADPTPSASVDTPKDPGTVSTTPVQSIDPVPSNPLAAPALPNDPAAATGSSNSTNTPAAPAISPDAAATEAPTTVQTGKICLDSGAKITDSAKSDWNVNGDTAETKNKVELGVKYIFPGNDNVSVTFTCLPAASADRTTLKIQQIASSDINLPEGVSAASEFAYDITTGMKDGDFKYDLTLPKSDVAGADINYIEKSADEVKNQELSTTDLKSVEDGKVKTETNDVKVSELDHFTVYIVLVVWNFPNNPVNNIADGGTADNLTKTITAVNTNAPTYNTSGATTNSARTDGWNNGADSPYKYWQAELNSTGFDDLKLSFKQRSSSTGPKEFKVQYSLNGTSWTDVPDGANTVADNYTTGRISDLPLPSACNNKASVFLRWVMTSNVAVNNAAVQSAGASNIDDIIVQAPLTMDVTSDCVNDSDGANDEPGQKDLTRICQDKVSIDPLKIAWNWDVIEMSGSNTADACSLFDTDKDGFANYSLCVTWDDTRHQITGSPHLYSCSDTAADRCFGSTSISTSSQCEVDLAADDPFSSDSDYPYDAKAYCAINLSDMRDASKAVPLDVCSYPSESPNSDPSDCVLISESKGNIEVVKDVEPDDQNTNWDIHIAGPTDLTETLNGDATTGIKNVSTGNYVVSESGHTGTDASFYSSAWSCNNDGTITSGEGTTTSSFSVARGDIVVCKFTNTLKTGTVIVHKDVQGPNGESISDTSQNFAVQLDGDNAQTLTDNGTVIYNNVLAGAHTITENVIPIGYSLYSMSPDGNSGTSGAQITVTTGQTADVYVTNRQQTTTVTVVKDVLNPDGGAVSDTHSFTTNLSPGSQSSSFAEGTNATFTVNPGTYTVTESDDPDYDEQGCKLVTGSDATDFSVPSGGSVTVTCTNKQKKATINVNKNVVAPDGTTDVSDNHAFTAQLNGGNNKSFSEQNPTSYSVNPGDYSITELSDSNYTYVSCTPDANESAGDGAQVTLGSHGSEDVTCVNKQKNATVTIVKDVRDPNGADVSDTATFTVERDGGYSKSFAEGSNATYALAPGTYTFTEDSKTGYTLHSISPDNDSDLSNGTTITLASGQDQTITFTNYQNVGSISGQKLSDSDGNLGTTNDQTNLVGWTINLYSCASDFSGCVLSATTTTFSGGYSFLNLIPGYYQVREALQSGWTNLTSLFQNETVNPGDQKTEVNFVNFENVSVTACKKIDADGDISTTNDQTNKFGWTVNLLTDGQVTNTRTTGEGGCYTWENLGPNHIYGVSEGVPSGWTSLNDTSSNFGTAQGGSEYKYTFVNFQNVSISGHKFNDLNGNGIWDSGEPGLRNWIIKLSGAKTDSMITDANGAYSFSDLGPGTYTLSETLQPGWKQTAPNGGTFTINAMSGTDVNGQDFGNQGQGTIQVIKNVDLDNDEDYTDANESNVSNWIWNIDGSGNFATGDVAQTLAAGTHTISEIQQDNFHVVDLNCDETDYGAVESQNITFNPGDNMVCTFDNARDFGTVTVQKITDPTPATDQFTINLSDTNGPVHTYSLNSASFPQDSFAAPTGTYSLAEDLTNNPGWDLAANPTCVSDSNNDDGGDGNAVIGPNNINLSSGENVTCTFTNTKRGSVTVTKFNDLNGNGTWDQNAEPIEPALSDWAINLAKDQTTTTQNTGANGQTTFSNLLAGQYNLSETIQTGWNQTNMTCSNDERAEGTPLDTSNNHPVFVNPGDDVFCFIGNNFPQPHLQISKSNDSSGPQAPGTSVTYTIQVTALDNFVNGVQLTDLPPAGFKYRSGSGTGAPFIHEYASPGVWDLGNMSARQTKTVSYVADIDSNQESGTYPDLAWAEGNNSSLIAEGTSSPYVNGAFVGTKVAVAKQGVVKPASVKIEKKTKHHHKKKKIVKKTKVLPATGFSPWWIALILAIFLAGLGFIRAGKRKKNKDDSTDSNDTNSFGTFLVAGLIGFSVLFGAQKAFAASDFTAQMEDPKSPVGTNVFQLGFVALDFSNDPIDVQCFVNSSSAPFQTIHLPGGGSSGNCSVDASVVPTPGTYQFHITAIDGAETATSQTVSVEYTGTGPGTPTNFNHDRVSGCQNDISFTTANDGGKTVRVEIYRSPNTSFTADASTLVTSLPAGSNQPVSYEDTISTNCQRFFYAVRAFDLLDNGSGVVGDTRTVTVTTGGGTTTVTTTTTAPGGGAIPAGGGAVAGAAAGGATGAAGGTVEGAQTPSAEGQTPAGEQGQVLGEEQAAAEAQPSFFQRHKTGTVIGVLILLALAYYLYAKKRNKKGGLKPPIDTPKTPTDTPPSNPAA